MSPGNDYSALDETAAHPRTIGWLGTTALAIGGSNQSVFIVGVLIVGQGAITGQGSAAIPLLALGMLLAWVAAPGWTELVLLRPGRVGGIAAACSEAFRPYSPMLSALAGCCYWWGWIPTCGLTAILSASAIHQWLVPSIPINVLAVAIVCIFTAVNLGGITLVVRCAIPMAILSASAAFLSAFMPLATGHVDWHRAMTFHLTTPFDGAFGSFTSLMAGLYLVGFAAPAFEAAACHVGETIDPQRNVPRAMFVSGALAGLYFVALPVIWLGVLGPEALGRDLALELGPTFAPLAGALAKAMAVGFMTFNMFHGTLQPLAGASRTLSQLADDAVFPRFLARRSRNDTPWVATVVTAAAAIAFLLLGDPIWLLAAANFTYLIAICLASVAVWLLRRDAPDLERPFRAPRGTIHLGLFAAVVWGVSAVFGFQQFGLATVILGLVFAYSGAALYAWRKLEDGSGGWSQRRSHSLQIKLTGLMVGILLFDGAGYFIAIKSIPTANAAMVATLQDIFVVVALLTIAVGLVLPGMVAQAATRELAIINESLLHGTQALQLEISERKLAEQRLLHVVHHDELTGLANRASFMERFGHMISRMQRRNDHIAAVLFLDLDRFKLVNDSLGHLAGDMLLVAVARRLERCLRPGDTLARLGGDEFTILLDDIHSERDAAAFAERVLAQLKKPFIVLERELFASASIGIAVTRTGFDTPEDVLRDADIAMYRAKELGKGRYEVFATEFLTRAVALLQLENDLQGALDRNEFVLFYQPIVSLKTNALQGFEALIRWQHPERGLLSPDGFIPAAEESGAILAIGAWVIDEACRQARLWEDVFHLERSLAISVNVSAKQFSNEQLLDQIQQALATHRLSSAHLHVEITESAIMANPELATRTLTELRRLGIEVHLDDFGTGYSSLGYLHRFPVDTLKIDRSFISTSGTKAVGNPEIVKTIASLAASLSMTTTAEGVETPEQLHQLRSLNCTSAQGYYFSRPVDAAAAGAIVAHWEAPRTLRESIA
ncbi:MAG: amino acid permease [Candidatus Eremiobacteraeota bacterium]|nr:amino acid permease [Candidatus Eremiobacteraeota bacterium]